MKSTFFFFFFFLLTLSTTPNYAVLKKTKKNIQLAVNSGDEVNEVSKDVSLKRVPCQVSLR